MRKIFGLCVLALGVVAADAACAQGAPPRDARQLEQPKPPVSPPPVDSTPAERGAAVEVNTLDFDRVDKNHDGFLALEEIAGLPVKLSECDKNGDGRIAREEYSHCRGPQEHKQP